MSATSKQTGCEQQHDTQHYAGSTDPQHHNLIRCYLTGSATSCLRGDQVGPACSLALFIAVFWEAIAIQTSAAKHWLLDWP